MPRHDYPASVAEVLDDSIAFKPETLRALRSFKKSKPWTGTCDERKEKFLKLNQALATVYAIPEPELVFGQLDGGSSGESHYSPDEHHIVLTGKLSVVTFLHEFCHARGMGERAACRWSVNLFRRVFPGEFARAAQVGHMLIHPGDRPTR